MGRRSSRGGACGGARRIGDGAAGREVGGTCKIGTHSLVVRSDGVGLFLTADVFRPFGEHRRKVSKKDMFPGTRFPRLRRRGAGGWNLGAG